MTNKIKQKTKASEAKKENSFSKTRGKKLVQSNNSPFNQSLFLQRTVGNQAVQRQFSSGTIQTKLKINKPGDRCEREADRVSKDVMRTPEDARFGGRNTESTTRGSGLESGPEDTSKKESSSQKVLSGGKPLPESLSVSLEPRLGRDLSRVRVHTDPEAALSAQVLNARAYTVGRDVVFAPGQYRPESHEGRQLLAHELTHVAQQDSSTEQAGQTGSPVYHSAAPQVQRSIFGDIWEGIKSVGENIGSSLSSAVDWIGDRAHDVGSFLSGAAEWMGERMRDAAMWVINIIRDLPARLARLASTIWEGLVGIVTFIPEAIQALASGGLSGFASWLWEKAKRGGAWLLTLISRVFDVLGGPELTEFIWHIVTKARPLTGTEIEAASSVLGPNAIRWGDVRVSQGGLLELIFALNDERAFVMFHTVNLPEGEGMDTVVHELTHVYQYERAGSVYLGQAIHAQISRGSGAYDYGGPDGLVNARASDKHFRGFNREEQAQIAQDYYRYIILLEGALTNEQRQAYEFYINELRVGDL